MNEKEKNAIEYLKTRLYGNEDCKYIDVAQEDLRVFIKLIEKLQKENKELKDKLSLKQFDINVVYNDYLKKLNEYKKNSIQKQKIKEAIKELEENIYRIKKQYSNGGENCNSAYLENLAQVKILKQILKESEE